MVQLPRVYTIQASDAPEHSEMLQKILEALKNENRIAESKALDPEVNLADLADLLKRDDLILIILTEQFESKKKQVEGRIDTFKSEQPGARVAEIIVDNVAFDNKFLIFPDDLKPLRDRPDKQAVWGSIEQSLKQMFPVQKDKEPEEEPGPKPKDWSNYLKIAGVLIGVILLFFIARGFMEDEPSGPLLTDDFSDGNMNGWRVIDEGNIAAPSNWAVVRAEVQQSSNIYGPDNEATELRKGTLAYFNNREAFSWDDYTFSAVVSSTDNDGIGLVFRYQDPNNYYKVDLDEQRNFSKLFKIVNGRETVLAHTRGPGYTRGVNFKLEVLVEGNHIQVLRDGNEIFRRPVTDNSLAAGTVGLYCWGNSNSFFDDVEVHPR